MGNLNDIPRFLLAKLGGLENHPYGFRGFSIGYTLDAVGPIVVASMLSIFMRAGSTMSGLRMSRSGVQPCFWPFEYR